MTGGAQAAPENRCEICGESETDPSLLADCSACGALYHLNPRSDREGKDCGDVRMGSQEVPAIQFFCNRCLEQLAAQAMAHGAFGRPDLAGPDAPPAGLTLDPLAAAGLAFGFAVPREERRSTEASSTSETSESPESRESRDPQPRDGRATPPAKRERTRRRFRRVDPT